MATRRGVVFSVAALCLAVVFAGSGKSFAKGKQITPGEVVAAHIKSIGNPEALGSIKNRGIYGTTTVQFILGGAGKMVGQSLLVSAGPNLGIILQYDALEYPGEHFAYNGAQVTVSNISPGQRSPLADFIYRYNGLMKEGLLGGVLSLGWPLLDLEKKQPRLKCNETKVEGHRLYEMEYYPKGDINDFKIKLFFEPDTFRHVRTEYRLVVRGEQALQVFTPYTLDNVNSPTKYHDQAVAAGYYRGPGILDAMADSIYLLVEKFGKFKEVQFKQADGEIRSLTLPQSYSIEYSVMGQGSTFLAHWNMDANQWIQNGKIDSSYFQALGSLTHFGKIRDDGE